MLLCFIFIFLSILQVAACFYFGLIGIVFNIFRMIPQSQTPHLNGTAYIDSRTDDFDCFIDFGAYEFCVATQKLSIASSIVMLMIQTFISRILFPGVSNFVNASVSMGQGQSTTAWHFHDVGTSLLDARCRSCTPIAAEPSANRAVWQHATTKSARRKLWR
jgi:hypothetical protein